MGDASSQKVKITVFADDLVSAPQAAKMLRVHHATVYRWIEKGKMHAIRIGGQVYLAVDEVNALKARSATRPQVNYEVQ